MQRFGIPATARATLALYNIKQEVDALVEGIGKVQEVFADVGSARALSGTHPGAQQAATQLSQAAGYEPPLEGRINEEMVWNRLRTVYDPEIPVNIVDLGLIYSCEITQLEERAKKIDIKMPITAPGCGMGNVPKADVESKLSRLPSVEAVSIDAVFDPPWNLSRMSETARLQLGI